MPHSSQLQIVAIPRNDVIDKMFKDFHTKPHWEVVSWKTPAEFGVRHGPSPTSFRSPQKHHPAKKR